MRSVAGGLVAGSGAFLFGTGAFTVPFAYARNVGFYTTCAGWAIFIVVVLILFGLGLIASDLRTVRRREFRERLEQFRTNQGETLLEANLGAVCILAMEEANLIPGDRT